MHSAQCIVQNDSKTVGAENIRQKKDSRRDSLPLGEGVCEAVEGFLSMHNA